jgi:hypothetical protein
MIEFHGELTKEACDYTFQNFDFETALDILFDASRRGVARQIIFRERMIKMSEDLRDGGYIWYDTSEVGEFVKSCHYTMENVITPKFGIKL